VKVVEAVVVVMSLVGIDECFSGGVVVSLLEWPRDKSLKR
jgi:hypothetical protein